MGTLLRALRRLSRGRILGAEEGRRGLHRLAVLYDCAVAAGDGGPDLAAEAATEALAAWEDDLGRVASDLPWRRPEAVLKAIRDHLRPTMTVEGRGRGPDGGLDYAEWRLDAWGVKVRYLGPMPQWNLRERKAEVVDLGQTVRQVLPEQVEELVALLNLVAPVPPLSGREKAESGPPELHEAPESDPTSTSLRGRM